MLQAGGGVSSENPKGKAKGSVVDSLDFAGHSSGYAVPVPYYACVVHSGVYQGGYKLFALAKWDAPAGPGQAGESVDDF